MGDASEAEMLMDLRRVEAKVDRRLVDMGELKSRLGRLVDSVRSIDRRLERLDNAWNVWSSDSTV